MAVLRLYSQELQHEVCLFRNMCMCMTLLQLIIGACWTVVVHVHTQSYLELPKYDDRTCMSCAKFTAVLAGSVTSCL